MREEKNEFQLFLFLRIPTRSAARVCKEYVDQILSFTSEKLRRDIIVVILAEVQVKYKAVQSVCSLAEA